ncbi:MAG: hypothetical protein HYS60_00205 [Candidatus Wildermuthbacteria bacterium]|nr:hypothetical protein [Candidatus Wildermuthbacteria bacterium]
MITYADEGYSPQTLSIKAGGTVSFVNQSSSSMWPASAMHPTHTVYPGSGIEKCGTAEQDTIFDACMGIPSEQEWSFQFNEKGTWKYHDHLNPSRFGTIVVE